MHQPPTNPVPPVTSTVSAMTFARFHVHPRLGGHGWKKGAPAENHFCRRPSAPP